MLPESFGNLRLFKTSHIKLLVSLIRLNNPPLVDLKYQERSIYSLYKILHLQPTCGLCTAFICLSFDGLKSVNLKVASYLFIHYTACILSMHCQFLALIRNLFNANIRPMYKAMKNNITDVPHIKPIHNLHIPPICTSHTAYKNTANMWSKYVR